MASHGRMHEIQGFKLGVTFATRIFEDIKHPFHTDRIEARQMYEWMNKPIRQAKDDAKKRKPKLRKK